MARFPQSEKASQRLSDILTDQGASQDSSLGGLLRRAAMLAQLQNVLTGALHPDLARNLRVANVRDQRLILITPSPAWATRLRMQSRQLLGVLRRAGLTGVDRVEVRVVPPCDWPAE
jgi:hypothetical protein